MKYHKSAIIVASDMSLMLIASPFVAFADTGESTTTKDIGIITNSRATNKLSGDLTALLTKMRSSMFNKVNFLGKKPGIPVVNQISVTSTVADKTNSDLESGTVSSKVILEKEPVSGTVSTGIKNDIKTGIYDVDGIATPADGTFYSGIATPVDGTAYSGNATPTDGIFYDKKPPSQHLVIAKVNVIPGKLNSAEVSWVTNAKANSSIWFSTSSPVDTSTPPQLMDKTWTNIHQFTLKGFTANTTYYMVVGSMDTKGNSVVSSQISFKI